MSSSNLIQILSDSKLNFKISWRLLKENWKAFLYTELFAVFTVLIFFIVFKTIEIIVSILFPSFFVNSELFHLTRPMMWIILILFLAFLTCQYGLAYDLLSSGDMFAEFKGSFIYFKKHWLAYSVITFLTYSLLLAAHSIFFFEFKPDSSVGFAEEHLIRIPALMYPVIIIFYIFSFILFSNVLPSLTAQENFKKSFSENFLIFKKNYISLFSNWGIFFVIFQLPTWIIAFIGYIVYDSLVGTVWWTLLSLLFIIFFISSMMIGTPMMSILATRIYNDYIEEDTEELVNNKHNNEDKEKLRETETN